MSAALAAVILAAGQGTRMKSSLPKVLHPVAGKPMLAHVVATARAAGAAPVVAVVGHGADRVRAAFADTGVHFALQAEQLGTGHALRCAVPALAGFTGELLLLCGDVPLLRAETLAALLQHHRRQGAVVTVLTAEMDDPRGYGRIIRGGDGVERIVEEKDATAQERAVREINTGIYVFAAPRVFTLLAGLTNDNAQGEYYLTDVVAAARTAGERVAALAAACAEETMGINDRVQLAEAGKVMRGRINEGHLRNGVTLLDPLTAYIEPEVTIGADTTIHPGVHLRGRTVVGRDCELEPGVIITDCTLGDRVHVKAGSVLAGSTVGADTDIGPMAHLRPGTVLAGENKIGNFVETKKAAIGKGSKASHLTYLGDAEIGSGVNVGCGTITCNYDGVNKHVTIIEDDVFVGSDVQFVAPVRVGRGSLIGAGSTITKDVPADALAITRAEQKVIEGWVSRKRNKTAKGRPGPKE
ncbi:MAG: bifunctional UDP-N-acetylglucosamine diphosphorylase/glucosamine-1-phosphate N-acetyltransferase GlmU [Deltaproteobacteria bacterium]|nr:MAG: bifunctional UDP-N-acetylglucosamine diphosphorylase/glucosamine-1-phosphate N-acetyltransferase GlmU [Deltaproteobacteria bacterium]